MRQFSVSSAVCLSLLACGGNNNNNKVSVVDAKGSGSGSGSGSGMGSCEAKASYTPTFGSNDSQQAQLGSNGQYAAYLSNISEANPIDLLDIELWEGSTDFPGSAATTGTFQLSGSDDSSYVTCGACALVWPQVAVGSNGMLTGLTDAYFASHQYMANGGSMTLTSVTGTLTGSLSNVTMRHVDIASGSNSLTETDDADGCKTTVTSVNFTATLGSAGFEGSTTFGMPVRINLRGRYR